MLTVYNSLNLLFAITLWLPETLNCYVCSHNSIIQTWTQAMSIHIWLQGHLSSPCKCQCQTWTQAMSIHIWLQEHLLSPCKCQCMFKKNSMMQFRVLLPCVHVMVHCVPVQYIYRAVTCLKTQFQNMASQYHDHYVHVYDAIREYCLCDVYLLFSHTLFTDLFPWG